MTPSCLCSINCQGLSVTWTPIVPISLFAVMPGVWIKRWLLIGFLPVSALLAKRSLIYWLRVSFGLSMMPPRREISTWLYSPATRMGCARQAGKGICGSHAWAIQPLARCVGVLWAYGGWNR